MKITVHTKGPPEIREKSGFPGGFIYSHSLLVNQF